MPASRSTKRDHQRQQLLLPQPAANARESAPAPHIVIDQIRTAQGNLRFADRSLSPEFVVDIASPDGQSRHISNTPGSARARLQRQGGPLRPVTIRGRQPAHRGSRAGRGRGLQQSGTHHLHPYSSTYAGYAIDKGQLSMKLNYKLQGNRLGGGQRHHHQEAATRGEGQERTAKDLPSASPSPC